MEKIIRWFVENKVVSNLSEFRELVSNTAHRCANHAFRSLAGLLEAPLAADNNILSHLFGEASVSSSVSRTPVAAAVTALGAAARVAPLLLSRRVVHSGGARDVGFCNGARGRAQGVAGNALL